MTQFKIKKSELSKIVGNEKKYPKYVSPILNLANRFSQATRPSVVGQLTELIKDCPEYSYEGWKEWYLSKNPDAIENATDKLFELIRSFARVFPLIDKSMVKLWVEDLVIDKTYVGLRLQEPILKWVSAKLESAYRLSLPEEESRGIDGYIGKVPVSIKPNSYKHKKLTEKIATKNIIYYEKTEKEIIVYVPPLEI